MKRALLSLLCVTAGLSYTSFAQADWSYDPINTENNTKESLTLSSNYTIDTNGGVLTVTGELLDRFKNLTITGSNDLKVGKLTLQYAGSNAVLRNGNLNVTGGKDSFVASSSSSFTVEGTSNIKLSDALQIQNATFKVAENSTATVTGNQIQLMWNGSLLLEKNATLNSKMQFLYEGDSGFVVSLDEGAKLNMSGGSLSVKNLTMNAGSSLSGVQYLKFKGVTTLNNLGASALVSTVELGNVASDAVINFNLGNNALECVDKSTAMLQGLYGKSMDGKINISLKDFILSEDFVSGNTYSIALGYSSISALPENWVSGVNSIVDGEFAKYVKDSLRISDKVLYIDVQAVPEPATYAAIFGALALAFVAYRRRK